HRPWRPHLRSGADGRRRRLADRLGRMLDRRSARGPRLPRRGCRAARRRPGSGRARAGMVGRGDRSDMGSRALALAGGAGVGAPLPRRSPARGSRVAFGGPPGAGRLLRVVTRREADLDPRLAARRPRAVPEPARGAAGARECRRPGKWPRRGGGVAAWRRGGGPRRGGGASPETWARLGSILARVHAVAAPDALPRAGMADARAAAQRQIDLFARSGHRLGGWLERRALKYAPAAANAAPHRDVLVHGDLH